MSKSRPSIASPLNFFMPKIMQQSLSNGNQSEDYNCLKFKTKSAGINSADFKKSIEGNLTPGARQLNQLLILKERREKNLPSSKISLNYNIHQGGQTDEHVCHTVSQNRATDSLKEFEELLKADSIFDSALQAKQQKTLENRIDELAEIEKNEIYMCNKQSVEKKCYKCVKCNYTAESISEFCKINNHTIQTVTRTKRFFKCNNCGKQLEILDRYPSEKCQKCNAYSWSKGSMWTKGDAKLKEALIIDDLTKINR
ncbi:MAG: minichromosome maintenance-related protein, variant 2 [Marteilia pararefringens]